MLFFVMYKMEKLPICFMRGDIILKIKNWKSRVAMALCVAMTGILVGCGATGEEESSVDMSEAGGKNTIVVLNYGEYIDTSVLKQFQKETGIKVLYEEATSRRKCIPNIRQVRFLTI